jgi:hypothetical protein
MTSSIRNIAGFSMLGAGLVVMLIAGLLAWGSLQRWLAVVETREAFAQLRRERVGDARKLAARAAERVPEEPAPALLAVDPTDAAALDRLVTIAARCPSAADRQTVLAAVGLMRLATGKPADVELEGTADGRLLAAIAAANSGRAPGRLEPVAGEAPPHLSVQRAAHTVLLRRAWQAGRVSEALAHAGALLLLRPYAAEAPAMRFLIAAGSPIKADAEVFRLADEIKTDREAVIRAVAALVGGRREAISAKWPKLVEGLP